MFQSPNESQSFVYIYPRHPLCLIKKSLCSLCCPLFVWSIPSTSHASLWIITSNLCQQFLLSLFTCLCQNNFLHPLLYPHHCHPPSQLNVTALDWSQLGKKECLKYGGSLVGKSCKYVPDLALMSFILFFGTYSMTVSLKKFKFSRYFPTKVKKLSISMY